MRLQIRSILSLKLLFLFSVLAAQDGQWEAGWQVLDTRPLPPGIEFTFTDDPGSAILNGLLLKHRSAGYKQRLSIQYIFEKEENDLSSCCGFFVADPMSYEGVMIGGGIEKSAALGPFEYYFLMDMNVGIGQYKLSNTSGGFDGRGETFNLRYRSLGANAGGGLSFWIARRVALNWELQWSGTFYKTRGSYETIFAQPGERGPTEGIVWQDQPESRFSLLLSIW